MGLTKSALFNMKRILRGHCAAFGLLFFTSVVSTFQPEFAEPIINLTIPLGREATFRCLVVHLGGYRVGWVKADTKAIQAIHDHVITHNPRVSVSHTDHSTWNLHIRAVVKDDQGQYMCQINTDPMKSQMGTLEVVIPPDFITEDTSGDLMVPEGGSSRLACRARGSPEPRVVWRREDGNDIIIKEPTGLKSKVTTYQGEVLKLSKVTRSEMGAYLCIASNGVPPSVSKRIMVNVHFHPVIQVPNQLVGAPLGTDVTLECYVEASPKSINYWLRDSNEMVINSYKYVVNMVVKSLFETKMTLTILRLQTGDAGGYRCVAKNSLGEVESNIRLYEIPGPTRKAPVYRFEEKEDEDLIDLDGSPNNQFGSAENDDEESDDDEKNNVISGRPRQNQQPSKSIGKDSTSANQPSTGKGKHNNKNEVGLKHDVNKTSLTGAQCNLSLIIVCWVLLSFSKSMES